MTYGSGPAPYPAGQAPYGAPQQFGAPQFGAPNLPPDVAPLPGASFGEAVKRFFQRYAQFRGYASRSEFWWSFLFIVVSLFALYLAFGVGITALIANDASDASAGFFGILTVGIIGIFGLATLLPRLAVMVRRLHDTGKSGLWVLFVLFGLDIVPLILCCFDSRPDLYRPEWS